MAQGDLPVTVPHERVYDVVCRKPGPFADLKNIVGSLVVEYDGDGQVTAVMFEPLAERIGNLDLPDVERLLMDNKTIRVQDPDDGMFVFEVLDDPMEEIEKETPKPAPKRPRKRKKAAAPKLASVPTAAPTAAPKLASVPTAAPWGEQVRWIRSQLASGRSAQDIAEELRLPVASVEFASVWTDPEAV
jgi:hypothetical protein